MEKQQTAVEFLLEEIECRGILTKELRIAFQQAIEMEKEQIIDAYKYGNQSDVYFKPEQYYNETFKK
jgi:hypothetical protein